MTAPPTVSENLIETEMPHTAPLEDPSWCENYCFDIHDRASSISMWLHVSRSQLHPRLWREVINVFLPDGRIGVWKGYGSGVDLSNGPSGPTLSCRFTEPFASLQLTCVGVVQLVTDEELRRAPLTDRVEHAFQFDLTWESATPVWDMRTHMADQIWASGHYEQGGRVRGSLSVDGEAWEIDGTGWRDHSIGRRNNALMQDHDWAHAVFRSGKSFAIFRHTRVGMGEDLRGAFASQGDQVREARLVSITPLESARVGESEDPYEIVLEIDGELQAIKAEVIRSCLSGSAPPAHQVLGRPLERGHVRWESQTLFEWDGETALGITERTKPLSPTIP
jgi:hypothetical protein